jgi:nicotinamide mononucleotide transporter
VIGWIGFLLALVGCIVNAKKSLWCWPIWLGSNACWLAVAVPSHQWPLVAMEATFVLINLYGWREWGKG